MRGCEHKGSMCRCIDWKKDDLVMQVNHLMNHFRFTGFELSYTTLGPEKNRRLCKVGQCRVCGKDLCIGTELPDQCTADDLLAEIFRRVFRLWHPSCDSLSDGANCFDDMFLLLFHESDRDQVAEWLVQCARSTGEGS